MPMQIEKILADSALTKGDYRARAVLSQQLKNNLRWHPNWDNLKDDQKESLEMIMDRASMILNGNPDNQKNWYSISVYAKLAGDSTTVINDISPSNDD